MIVLAPLRCFVVVRFRLSCGRGGFAGVGWQDGGKLLGKLDWVAGFGTFDGARHLNRIKVGTKLAGRRDHLNRPALDFKLAPSVNETSKGDSAYPFAAKSFEDEPL